MRLRLCTLALCGREVSSMWTRPKFPRVQSKRGKTKEGKQNTTSLGTSKKTEEYTARELSSPLLFLCIRHRHSRRKRQPFSFFVFFSFFSLFSLSGGPSFSQACLLLLLFPREVFAAASRLTAFFFFVSSFVCSILFIFFSFFLSSSAFSSLPMFSFLPLRGANEDLHAGGAVGGVACGAASRGGGRSRFTQRAREEASGNPGTSRRESESHGKKEEETRHLPRFVFFLLLLLFPQHLYAEWEVLEV